MTNWQTFIDDKAESEVLQALMAAINRGEILDGVTGLEEMLQLMRKREARELGSRLGCHAHVRYNCHDFRQLPPTIHGDLEAAERWTHRQGLWEPGRRSKARRCSESAPIAGDVYRAVTMQPIKPGGLRWESLRRNPGGAPRQYKDVCAWPMV